ncbi:MAG: ATP-binding cassette domain-containing protein [Spirochaetota bacterium]
MKPRKQEHREAGPSGDERRSELECRNISHFYDSVRALNGVSLRLRDGEMLGLVGDNGAGKSTLVKILRGVIRPTSGEIIIKGEPRVFNSPRDALHQGIQCVYQEQALVDQLSVAENFFLGQEPVKSGERALIKIVDRLRMIEESSSYLERMGFTLQVDEEIQNFSGGQKQAVSILRALYFNPAILLLDEPTTALSEKAKKRLFTLLEEIKKDCPMILITHDIFDAVRMCDRILVMKHGEIVYELQAREGMREEEAFREIVKHF